MENALFLVFYTLLWNLKSFQKIVSPEDQHFRPQYHEACTYGVIQTLRKYYVHLSESQGFSFG